jgi:predicted nucleic acid-binding protein
MIKNKINAIIDSSFWINITRVDLNKSLIDYFNLYSTNKVKEELFDFYERKGYFSKDSYIFKLYLETDFIYLKDPKEISLKIKQNLSKDSGELYSVALLKEIDGVFLTDDKGAINFCKKNNILVITSVYFIVRLYKDQLISKEKAEFSIMQLKGKISKEYLSSALNDL